MPTTTQLIAHTALAFSYLFFGWAAWYLNRQCKRLENELQDAESAVYKLEADLEDAKRAVNAMRKLNQDPVFLINRLRDTMDHTWGTPPAP